MDDRKKILEADQISAFYAEGGREKKVVDNLSFSLFEGEFIVVIGRNGSGKSTLLRTLAGLHENFTGNVVHSSISPKTGDIGLLWQNYRESLLPWRSLFENVAFSLEIQGVSKGHRYDMVKDHLLKYFEKSDFDKPIYKFSGGQQQLACILRNICSGVKVLLADEPFSALDLNRSRQLLDVLSDFRRTENMSAIWVTHDIDEALLLADRIIILPESTEMPNKVISLNSRHPRDLSYLRTFECSEAKEEIYMSLTNS